MAKNPKVSILCLTYNQKDFVRQTLDGFLMQKTDFAFEVLINDDASTDGTAEIIKEYQKKYPDIIKPILQKENMYSKGFRGMFTEILFPQAKGEYLALCEGDDYWTDIEKLQIQVDFMDKHPAYSVCFHKVIVHYEQGQHPDQIYPDVSDEKWYTTEQLLRVNFIQTNSVLYRKQDYKNIATDVMPGDWYMHLFHAHFGKIKLIDRVMSVYRKHENGVWWEYDINRHKIWKEHFKSYLRLLAELMKLFGDNPNYQKIIYEKAAEIIGELIEIDEAEKTHLAKDAFESFPDFSYNTLLIEWSGHRQQKDRVQELTNEVLKIGDERSELVRQIDAKQAEAVALAAKIDTMEQTRTWQRKIKADQLKDKLRGIQKRS